MQGLSDDVVRWAFVAAAAAYVEKEALNAALLTPYRECLKHHGERYAFFVQDRLLVLGYRGTADFEDVVNDFDTDMSEKQLKATRGGKAAAFGVHTGFWKAAELIKDTEIVDKLVASADTIVVSGHSLGGAIAVLKTFRLVTAAQVNGKAITCIGIAAPLVGDRRLRQLFLRQHPKVSFHVIVNGSDGVPRALYFLSVAGGIKGLWDDIESRADPDCLKPPTPKSDFAPIGTYHFLSRGKKKNSYKAHCFLDGSLLSDTLLIGPTCLSLGGITGDHALQEYVTSVMACCAVDVPFNFVEDAASKQKWAESAIKVLAKMHIAKMNSVLPAGTSVEMFFEDPENGRVLTGVELNFSAAAWREVTACFSVLFFTPRGAQHAEKLEECAGGVCDCSGKLVVKRRACGWTLMQGKLQNTYFSLDVSTRESTAPRGDFERRWLIAFCFRSPSASHPACPGSPSKEAELAGERERIEDCLRRLRGVPQGVSAALAPQLDVMRVVLQYEHSVPNLRVAGAEPRPGCAPPALQARFTLKTLEFAKSDGSVRLALTSVVKSGLAVVMEGAATFDSIASFLDASVRESLSDHLADSRSRLPNTTSPCLDVSCVVWAPPRESGAPIRLDLLKARVASGSLSGGLCRVGSSELEPVFYLDGAVCGAKCIAILSDACEDGRDRAGDFVTTHLPLWCVDASYQPHQEGSVDVPDCLRFLTDRLAFQVAVLMNAAGRPVRRLFKIGPFVADEGAEKTALVLGAPLAKAKSTGTTGCAVTAGGGGTPTSPEELPACGRATASTFRDAALLLGEDAETRGFAGCVPESASLPVYVRMESDDGMSALHVTDIQLALAARKGMVVYRPADGWLVEVKNCALSEVIATLDAMCGLFGVSALGPLLRHPFVSNFMLTVCFRSSATGSGAAPTVKWLAPLRMCYVHGASSIQLVAPQDVLERPDSALWQLQLTAQVDFDDLRRLCGLPGDGEKNTLGDALQGVAANMRESPALRGAVFAPSLLVDAAVYTRTPPTVNKLVFTLVSGVIFGFAAKGHVSVIKPQRDARGRLSCETLTAVFDSASEEASAIPVESLSDMGVETGSDLFLGATTADKYRLCISLGRAAAGSFSFSGSVLLGRGRCSVAFARVRAGVANGADARYRGLLLLTEVGDCAAAVLLFVRFVLGGAITIVPESVYVINAGDVVEWPTELIGERKVPQEVRDGWKSPSEFAFMSARITFEKSAVTDFFELTGTSLSVSAMRSAQGWCVTFTADSPLGDILPGRPTSYLRLTWSEKHLAVEGTYALCAASSEKGASYMELSLRAAVNWVDNRMTGTLESKYKDVGYSAAAVFHGGWEEKQIAQKFVLCNLLGKLELALNKPSFSLLIMARICINVANSPPMYAEGAIRVANGLVGLIYGHFECLSFSTIIGIFMDLPESLVKPLNTILFIKRFGFIFKADRLAFDRLPGERGGAKAAAEGVCSEDNIILEALNRRSDEVVLKATEMGFAVGADVTFLSVKAKCMLAVIADTSRSRNRSMLRFKFVLAELIVRLGKSGPRVLRIGGAARKDLTVELMVSAEPKGIFAMVDASISLFPDLFNVTVDAFFVLTVNQQVDLQALGAVSCAQSASSPSAFLEHTTPAKGVFLGVVVRMSLFGDAEKPPLLLTESDANSGGGIVFEGRLLVRCSGSLFDARLSLRLVSEKGILQTLVKELLEDRLKKFLATFSAQLKSAEKDVEESNMCFVSKIVVKALVKVGSFLLKMAEKMVDVVTSVLKWIAKAFDIVELQVGGMVGHGEGVGVQAAWKIRLLGTVYSGSVSVNLRSIFSDLCKHLAFFCISAASKDASPVMSCTRTFSDGFDQEGEQKEESYDFSCIPTPAETYTGEAHKRDKPTLDEIRAAVRSLQKKLAKARASQDEYRKPSTEELLQASHQLLGGASSMLYQWQCPWCDKLLDRAVAAQHALDCKRRPTEKAHGKPMQVKCEFCEVQVDDVAKHYGACTGAMRCDVCAAWQGKRCDWDAHIASDCAKRDACDTRCVECGLMILAGESHACPEEVTCVECEALYKRAEGHVCDTAKVCSYCEMRVSDIDRHLDRECLMCDLVCEKCNGSITRGKGKETPMQRREWHDCYECSARSCEYCGELVVGSTQLMEHEQLCSSKFFRCNVDGCAGYLQYGAFHEADDNTVCPYCNADAYTLVGLRRHLSNACQLCMIACLHCGERVVYSEYKQHLAHCTKVRFLCWGCGALLPGDRDQVAEHLVKCVPLPCVVCGVTSVAYTQECASLRKVPYVADHWRDACAAKPLRFPCPKCHQEIEDDLVTHVRKECKAFTVDCPFQAFREAHDSKRGRSTRGGPSQCSAHICFASIGEHLRDCPSVLVPCPFSSQCFAQDMTIHALMRHLSSECAAFVVSCPFEGCWKKMAKKNEEAHWREYHCHEMSETRLTVRNGFCDGSELNQLTYFQRALLISDIPELADQAEADLLQSRAQVHRLVVGNFYCRGCGCELPIDEKNEHLTYECDASIAPCPLKCGLALPASEMVSHIRDSCPLARGSCAHVGCYQPLLDQDTGALLRTNAGIPISTFTELVTACRDSYDFFTDVAPQFALKVAKHTRTSSLTPICSTGDSLSAQYAALYAVVVSRARELRGVTIRKRHECLHAVSCARAPQVCLFCWDVLRDTGSMDEHVKVCPDAERTTQCQYCQSSVALRKLSEHWVQGCSGFLMDCPLKCGDRVTSDRTLLHLYTECNKAQFTCRCGTQLNPKSVFVHLVYACKEAQNRSLVCCPLCRMGVPVADYVNGVHYTDCAQYQCRCPLEVLMGAEGECGVMKFQALGSHLVPDAGGLPPCPHVKSTCGKCGETVRRDCMHHHLLHECEKNYYICENAQFGCEAGEQGEDGHREVLKKHYFLKECKNFPMRCGQCGSLIGRSQEAQQQHLEESCRRAEWECRCGFKSSRGFMQLHRARTCLLRELWIHDAVETHLFPLKKVPHDLKSVHGKDAADWSHSDEGNTPDGDAIILGGTAGSVGGAALTMAGVCATTPLSLVGLGIGAICGALASTPDCSRCGKPASKDTECSSFQCMSCGERSSYTEDWCAADKYAVCRQLSCPAYGKRESLQGKLCMRVCAMCGGPEKHLKQMLCVSMECRRCHLRDTQMLNSGCTHILAADLGTPSGANYRRMMSHQFYKTDSVVVPVENDNCVKRIAK